MELSDTLFKFITILSWIVGVGSLVLIAGRIYARSTYTDLDQLRDMTRGYIRTFPIFTPLLVSIVCWTWIIAVAL